MSKPKPRESLSHSLLVNSLRYDEGTGDFYWREDYPGRMAGRMAGCMSLGYVVITIDTVPYYAHRLAWFYVHQVWPTSQLDHINRKRDDNRICNLREVDYIANAQNQKKAKNNTSGHKGVSWVSRDLRWKVSIQVNKKSIHLGCFTDLTQAVKARKDAEQKYGFSPTH